MSTDAGAAAPTPATVAKSAAGHIRLTSHSGGSGSLPIHWDAPTAAERGPVIGTTIKRAHRNVIGTHSGSYSVYRALAVAAGALSREHRAESAWSVPGRGRLDRHTTPRWLLVSSLGLCR